MAPTLDPTTPDSWLGSEPEIPRGLSDKDDVNSDGDSDSYNEGEEEPQKEEWLGDEEVPQANPVEHLAIEETEIVDVQDHLSVDLVASGFMDGHLPTPIEAQLLKGKEFGDWGAFDVALDEYEAQAGWSFKRVTRNKKRLIARCRGWNKGDLDSCKAGFTVRFIKATGKVTVRKSHLIHTCPQDVHAWRHGAHKRRWVEGKVESIIRVNQDTSNKDLRAILRTTHSADTTKWTAQRARQHVIKSLGGDEASSFTKIPSYVLKVKERDPGTHVFYETYNEDHRFRRIYMAPASSQNAFNHVRPFVGMDATHSVVGVENEDNWVWFMSYLDQSYPRIRTTKETVIVSNRDKGLIPAVQYVWGNINHSFCTQHIQGNIITNFDNTLGDWFMELAEQVRKVDFDRMLDEYHPLNPRQKAGLEYIRAIDPALYARHAFPVPRWGHTSSNVVEILNRVIKPMRRRPILMICKELWDYTMTEHYERATTASSWPIGESALTQYATIQLNMLYTRADGVEERPSSCTSGLMCDNQGQWALDLEAKTCECKEWQEMGFPCVHVVKFCQNRGLDEKVYIEDNWKAISQVQAYSINLPPVSMQGVGVDMHCLEPLIVPSENKVKKMAKRKACRWEKTIADEKLAMKEKHCCTICGKPGHNRRGCVAPHQIALVRMKKSSDFLRVCANHTLEQELVEARWLFWDSRPGVKLTFSQWYEEMYPLRQPEEENVLEIEPRRGEEE